MFAYIIAAAMVVTLGFSHHKKEVELGGGAKIIETTDVEGVGYRYTPNGFIVVRISKDGIYSISASDSSGQESIFISIENNNLRVLLNSNGPFFAKSDSLFVHKLEKPTGR